MIPILYKAEKDTSFALQIHETDSGDKVKVYVQHNGDKEISDIRDVDIILNNDGWYPSEYSSFDLIKLTNYEQLATVLDTLSIMYKLRNVKRCDLY